MNQDGHGSIYGQGTDLHCRLDPQCGVQEAVNQLLSPIIDDIPPFLFEINKNILKKEKNLLDSFDAKENISEWIQLDLAFSI